MNSCSNNSGSNSSGGGGSGAGAARSDINKNKTYALPDEDMHKPPEDLPPYREAAMNAWEKAKEAGAGKFTPGGLGDDTASDARLRAPLDTEQQKQQEPVPPPVRSVLTFGANTSMFIARSIRSSPGVQGGLFYRRRSFCYSAGYRDGHRGMHEDDKGNYLRLKDPLGLRTLTTVFFGHLVWMLHKEGHVDMFEPISASLPELREHRTFDALFPRDILGLSVGMDDATVLSALYKNNPLTKDQKWAHGGMSTSNNKAYHNSITLPLNTLFSPSGVSDPQPSRPEGSEMLPPPRLGQCGTGGADASPSSLTPNSVNMGFLMRQRLVAGVAAAAPLLPRSMPKIQNPRYRRPSHFAFALLAASIERKMNGTPIEELFRTKVTEPLGVISVGFGIPQILYRSSMFWQPTGLPCTHYTLQEQIRPGDARHAASPIFNASLNAFGNPEDVAKVLVDVLVSAKEAIEKMPQSGYPGARWHELGWAYEAHNKRFVHLNQWGFTRRRSPVEYTPYAASASYDHDVDAGSFCVANCGNRKSMLVTNLGAQMVSKLFIKQCIETGMELEPTDEAGRSVSKPKMPGAAAAAAAAEYDDGGVKKWESDLRPTPGFAQKQQEGKSSSKKKDSAATTKAPAETLPLSKEAQMEFMRKQEEEQKKAIDEETNSFLNRASKFFKSGRVNTDGHKRF